MSSLPILDNAPTPNAAGSALDDIRIAAPCSAPWEAMHGDDRVRFCSHCTKNVYNLSAMPRADAEALLLQHEGDLCVRLYRRADGTVLTEDCPVGVRGQLLAARKNVRRAVWAGVSMAATLLAGIGVQSGLFTRLYAALTEPAFLPVQGGMRPEPRPTPVREPVKPMPEPTFEMGEYLPEADPAPDAKPATAGHGS